MSTVEIVFSPTGGTERVARAISSQWGGKTTRIDLSDPHADYSQFVIGKDDDAVVAMPVFGGRAPAVAIERLSLIKGNGARCTVVCVYGNRDFDDALVEMRDAAARCGFNVVAAVAAVAEHSIVGRYAAGRPDAQDKQQLEEFARRIAGKTDPVSEVPGNRPYKKAGGAPMVPKPTSSCTRCGRCARECPVGAIDPKTFEANAKACISCMRCARRCPQGARKVSRLMTAVAAAALKKACSERKDNKLYL